VNIGFLTIPTVLTVLFVVDFFFAITVIFIERKTPAATLAWVMVIFLVPVVGIFFYVMLSQNIAKQKLYRLTQRERELFETHLSMQIDAVKQGSFTYRSQKESKWKDLILLNQHYSHAYLSQDNRLEIFTDGNHLFASLLADIRAAKESINLQYFIVKNDVTGRRLISELTQKAREGVHVRFLLDALGSRRQSAAKLAEFREAGGSYALFFPPKFRYLNMKLNYRNHRKIVVVDGRVGYLGGYNIGNEYLDKKKKFGHWRDTHLRLEGEGVADLNTQFFLDWRIASREEVSLETAYQDRPAGEGSTAIQIVNSGPESLKEEIKHTYLRMINSAKRNVYIQSPYFVPDLSIFESLQNAAFAGVDVRVMIPNKPDHAFVYWATYYYCGLLLRAGVRVFIYDKGFLHAKTLCVDGEVCSVGSANFDNRSFRLNFETNAVIYDEDETFKLESIFEQDIADSIELTRALYAKRSLRIKFKEGISKLLSDLL
jgi:cardiolipin synthase